MTICRILVALAIIDAMWRLWGFIEGQPCIP